MSKGSIIDQIEHHFAFLFDRGFRVAKRSRDRGWAEIRYVKGPSGVVVSIDASVPRGLSIHDVLDNLSAHTAPEITKWLAHPRRKRWHLHFTPTSSSWVNLVERWFKELSDRRLRRGVFTSVADLIAAIETWASHWNLDPMPFVWHKPAAEIIEKVRRGRAALHQIKSATDH